MAPEKVIQDSDDEGYEDEIPTSADPLQQSPPSQGIDGGTAPAPQREEIRSNVDAGQSAEGQSPKMTSGNDLGVNFDDFLQSQSPAKQSSVSPLQPRQRQQQQQREGGTQIADDIAHASGMLS